MNTEAKLEVHENKIASIESDVKEIKVDIRKIGDTVFNSAKHAAELTATVKQAASDLTELKEIVAHNHDAIDELRNKVSTEKSYQEGVKSALQETSKRTNDKTLIWVAVVTALFTGFMAFVGYHEWKDKQINNTINTTVVKKDSK